MSKRKSRLINIVILVAVVILPLAYSLFYLGAFWDPYGKLSDLPVAVVNEDKGAMIAGETRNLGDELVKELKDDASLKWTETDKKSAEDGVRGTEYYASISIPQNFSSDVASASSPDHQTAHITYTANEKRNFLVAQILNRAVLEMEEKLRSNVNKELTEQLVRNLNDVPSQLADLSDGLGKIGDAAGQLSDGINQLSDGQNTLANGMTGLDSGLGALSAGADSLTENLYALHQGIAQTKSGVDQAMSALSGSAAQSASITDGIDKLSKGAQMLSGGLSQAADGAKKLSAAASSETAGLPALGGGIDRLDTGTASLSKGVSAYIDGVDALIAQNKTLAGQLSALSASTTLTDAQKVDALRNILAAMSSQDALQAVETLSVSGVQLKAGSAAVASGADSLKASESSLAAMQTGISNLSDALAQLNGGASQLSAGIGQMQTQASSLLSTANNLKTLSGALNQLNSGSQALYDGSKKLTDGSHAAKSAGSQLSAGAASLQDGAAKLRDGAAKLDDGVSDAKTAVDNSAADANDQLKSTKGLAAFAADPVDIIEAPINAVPNYGTAFAPYFISLSLYVGAIIMFVGIYLDADEKIKTLSRSSERKFIRVGVFALIGVAQAVVLALLAKYGLGLEIKNTLVYYLSCILTSMVFISIVEFFIVCLKDTGKFLALLFLILQLTSCGGTFPMELVPKFFNLLYRFMPMTYSVNLFKEAISGFDSAAAGSAAIVLVAIGAFFTGLTMLFSLGKKAKEKHSLEKKVLAESVSL